MNRNQCLRKIMEMAKNNPVIFTTGYTCREAYAIEDKPNHFYMVGSMGLAASIGIGLALFRQSPVFVVDGDGSFLMNPTNLFLASTLRTANLIHIVLDNQTCESTGGQRTDSETFDFSKIAKAARYPLSSRVSKPDDFSSALSVSLEKSCGPVLIHADVEQQLNSPGPRIDLPLFEVSKRFKISLLENKLEKYHEEKRYENWCGK